MRCYNTVNTTLHTTIRGHQSDVFYMHINDLNEPCVPPETFYFKSLYTEH